MEFLGSDGRQGSASAIFVGCHVGEAGLGYLHYLVVSPVSFCIDLHRHGDRRSADLQDIGVETEQIPDKHRLLENKGVDGDGGHPAAGTAGGGNGAGDVDLRHDPSAKYITMEIRVLGHGRDPQDGLPFSWRKKAFFGAHVGLQVNAVALKQPRVLYAGPPKETGSPRYKRPE